ncbi:hypothetical protein [Varibaculum cambriense]|uniref:hypothetical protein n=1 Tax=Varibaculum cambriense TaxID=184870 RepID=UPI0025553CDB|nr:hypothetical protein [Varibaculum cambriense]MDK8274426.1 hypothetical protein [Varibaculum cambriense]
MNLNPNGVAQLNQAVAAEVRAEIARQKLQVVKLAPKASMTRDELNSRVNGRVAFTATDLKNVADAMGIDPALIIKRAEETFNPACPTASAMRQTAAPATPTMTTLPETAPLEPEPLADEAEAGMWQAVLDHKARCAACDTLLQAQTHLTQLALTEEEQRYIRHLRYLARADAASRNAEVA